MIKNILIVLFFVFTALFIYSAEKADDDEMLINTTDNSVVNSDSSFNSNTDDGSIVIPRHAKVNNSSAHIIQMGKVLTKLAVGGFVSSSILFSLSAIPLFLVYSYSGMTASTWSWATFALMLNIPHIAALTATTLAMWAIASLLSGFTIFLIPGIIIWSIGIAKSKRDRVTMLTDNIGFAVRL